MRLHRFFVEESLAVGKEYMVRDEELLHQWKSVFRLRTGEEVLLLDNSGHEFSGRLIRLMRNEAVLEIFDSRVNILPKGIKPYEIHLYQSLIKKSNFEWILEKGTELGVTRFVPLVTERSEKKDFNIERAQKIMKEASEQSGRGFLPTLAEVSDLKEALRGEDTLFIAFHPTGTAFSLPSVTHVKKVAVFIGPEGGWTASELGLFAEAGVQVYSLGPQTLRAETAAVAVSALFLL